MATSLSINDTALANPTVFPSDTQQYLVTATDFSGCTSADSIVIMVNPEITANAGMDLFICYGDSIQLMADTFEIKGLVI